MLHADEPIVTSLWDRIRDRRGEVDSRRFSDATDGGISSRAGRQRQMDAAAAAIEINLIELLSTRRARTDRDLDRWPAVRASVLHFGIPDFTGTTASGIDSNACARQLKAIIARHEPRLHDGSVDVHCHVVPGRTSEFSVVIAGAFGPADGPQRFEMTATICLQGGPARKAA